MYPTCLWLRSAVVSLLRKSWCRWTCAAQIHAVQGSMMVYVRACVRACVCVYIFKCSAELKRKWEKSSELKTNFWLPQAGVEKQGKAPNSTPACLCFIGKQPHPSTYILLMATTAHLSSHNRNLPGVSGPGQKFATSRLKHCTEELLSSLFKCGLLSPVPRDSDFLSLGWSLKICISNTSPEDVMLLVWGPHWESKGWVLGVRPGRLGGKYWWKLCVEEKKRRKGLPWGREETDPAFPLHSERKNETVYA